jgi:dihydropteroate synthase
MPLIRTYKQTTYNLEQNTLVMGVLQVKPAKHSAGGLFYDTEQAAEDAARISKEGAHFIDIVSIPDHEQPPSPKELISVIRNVCRATNTPVAVNTSQAELAKQALEAGAAIIRDTWGGRKGREILNLAASANVPVILTHNRQKPAYKDLVGEIKADVMISAALAVASGIPEENIILDPGFGLGKTQAQSLHVLKYLHEYSTLGYPLLLDTITPPDWPFSQGAEECAAAVTFGISRGARIIRVHNVAAMSRVARMTDTILNPK